MSRCLLKSFCYFLTVIFLFGCSEGPENENRSKKDEVKEVTEVDSSVEDTGFTKSAVPNIEANQGRLEFNSYLLLDENQPSILFRYVEITALEPVTKIQSRVFIDKTIFSGAMVDVGIELLYQRTDYIGKNKRTSVKNQLSYKEEGFKLSNTAIGCKNSDCSDFYESSVKDENGYPVNRIINVEDGHVLYLEWDDKNFGFIFGLDKARGFLGMDEFVHESRFDPQDFLHARLFVSIKKTKSTQEGSRVLARFGNVYVNDELYDDFEGDHLDSGKWKAGEIYR